MARKRRLRRLLKPLPRRANIARYPVVKWFADAARARPYLWSFKPAQVRPALYVGSVICLMPLPGQVLLAFLAALGLRANLPIAVAMQFVSNPFTFIPFTASTYITGYTVLHALSGGRKEYQLAAALDAVAHGDFSGGWGILAALLVGSVLVGLAMGFALDLLWRFAAWEAERFRDRFRHLHRGVHGHAPPGAMHGAGHGRRAQPRAGQAPMRHGAGDTAPSETDARPPPTGN